MSNTFGTIFKLTTFGESHGHSIGGIIDGMPSGITIDLDFIQSELDKRAPGKTPYSSQRKEKDQIKILSGVFENISLGTPIAFEIKNIENRSEDYNKLVQIYRPGHADYTYDLKYSTRDWRGGGRSSARETISRVVGGAFAKLILKSYNVSIFAFVSQIGNIKLIKDYKKLDLNKIYESPVRCPDEEASFLFEKQIKNILKEKDSIGGTITCIVKNSPFGLGEPVFDKFHSRLGAAILSINACKGFEIGAGFGVATMKGSENNDQMFIEEDRISFLSNNAGGVIGGITNGEDIYFRAAFKPTPTIFKEQQTISKERENVKFTASGRHDPCVVPRAAIIVEAMTAMTIVDFIFQQNNQNIL